MTPEIRRIEPDDVAECVRFGLESFRPIFASFEEHYGEGLFHALRPDWVSAQTTYIREACTDEGKEAWVAVVDGRVVGFIVLAKWLEDGLGQIDITAVDPEHQGRGVGTALSNFGIERLRDEGLKFVIVGTGSDPGHAPARRAYDKAGFEPMPIQPLQFVYRL